jgi:hypothetical protein
MQVSGALTRPAEPHIVATSVSVSDNGEQVTGSTATW